MTRQRVTALEAGEVGPTYNELITLAEKGLGVRPSVLVICADELRDSTAIEAGRA